MKTQQAFDYIVVGAGSAGCVLAARLSQDPNIRVALVEAGGPDDAPEVHMPVAFPQLFKTKYDWDFTSEPEAGLGNRRIYLPRGKTLGGSSAMNAMIYIRGNPADFDGWADEGAPGWSYREMLPYFMRAEGNERGDPRYHGHSGPLAVQDGRSMHPLVDYLLEAGARSGYRSNVDFNGPSQMGLGRFQLTQRNGVRCSSASAYLHPARERANLQVFTDNLVLRLLLKGNRAIGVSIHRNGQEETLLSEGEIILAAGAYGSPQILMLSGIGPAEQLAGFGISTVVDLPVGANLQDHPLLPISYLTDERSLFGAGSPDDVALYQEGRGPLTSNVAEGGIFLSTRGDESVPDCQFEMAPAMYFDEGLSAPTGDALTMTTTILKLTSRGRVTLRSARADAKPRIYHNYLATYDDRVTMIASVWLAMDLFAQPNLSKVRRAPFSAPASDAEADLVAFIEQQTGTNYHPTSTCAIGSVVDTDLRVFDTEGLRVADASVMPSIVRGNTNAAVIAIAEKAADILLANGSQMLPFGGRDSDKVSTPLAPSNSGLQQEDIFKFKKEVILMGNLPLSEEAKAIVRRSIEEVQGGGNFDLFEELFADAFVDNTTQPGTTPDKAGVRELYSYLRRGFPDLHAEIHWQLVDGDCVTTYKTYRNTHEGIFLDVRSFRAKDR